MLPMCVGPLSLGVTPSRSRSRPTTVSGSGAALAGSPQPLHNMSTWILTLGFAGRRAVRPALRLHCDR